MLQGMAELMAGGGVASAVFVLLFALIALVLMTLVASLVRGVGRWQPSHQSSQVKVEALVVAKRMDVTGCRHDGAENHDAHNVIDYYVTFQVESGERMELGVTGEEYGMMAEGDQGRLTLQGTRFLGFERA